MEEKEVRRMINEILDQRRNKIIRGVGLVALTLLITFIVYVLVAEAFLVFVLKI